MHYIPCRAHSLNLVGVNAIELNSKDIGDIFTLLQSIYTFCSASTSRWGKVVRNTKVKSTLKSLSSTRWYDPTKALWENYTVIKEASFAISISETEKRETKKEAERICFKIGTARNSLHDNILEYNFRTVSG